MNEKDTNKLYLIYYFIIDSIVLDYYYRFQNIEIYMYINYLFTIWLLF